MKPRRTTVVVLLIPLLALNLSSGFAKSCNTIDEMEVTSCCGTTASLAHHGKGESIVMRSCSCQILDESSAEKSVAIVGEISRPKSKEGAKQFLIFASILTFVHDPQIASYRLNDSSQDKFCSHIKIYDFLASYLI